MAITFSFNMYLPSLPSKIFGVWTEYTLVDLHWLTSFQVIIIVSYLDKFVQVTVFAFNVHIAEDVLVDSVHSSLSKLFAAVRTILTRCFKALIQTVLVINLVTLVTGHSCV